MKHLILLTLSWTFSFSLGEHCNIVNGKTLSLSCSLENTKPIHVIKDESVSCGTVKALREGIETIDIETCRFDDFNSFKNCTMIKLKDIYEIKSIRQETFIGMNQLTRISIVRCNVEVLASAFSGLLKLRQVDFIDINLNLSASAFFVAHHLKSLKIKDSWSVPKSSLPPGLFRDLHDLELLDLHQYKNISSIDFIGLQKVKCMFLDKNFIFDLTRYPLYNLENLKYLSLTNNYLRKGNSTTFSQLHNLIGLHLDSNYIQEISASIFNGLTNLRTLTLRSNSINLLEGGAFSTLQNLKKLDLSIKKLTALDEHSLQGLDNLKYLSLKYNCIATIYVNTFVASPKLIQLDLSQQDGLETLDLNAFPQFIDLQTSNVIHSTISSEPDDFEKEELAWFNDIFSFGKKFDRINNIHSALFGQFQKNKNEDNRRFDLKTHIMVDRPLSFGNLDLSGNLFTSINVDKRH